MQIHDAIRKQMPMDYSTRRLNSSHTITTGTNAHVTTNIITFVASEANSDASSRRFLRSLLRQEGFGFQIMQQ